MKIPALLIILSVVSCNNSGNPDQRFEDQTPAYKTKTMNTNNETRLKISSTAFADGEKMPAKYTCDGNNINPPLKIEGFPTTTQTFALILEDPDAPAGNFIHWLCWNIPPVEDISENSSPGIQGKNTTGKSGYSAPCPPAGKPHHYIFNVYALDTRIDLHENAERVELEKAMQGHIIAKGKLTGLYSKD